MLEALDLPGPSRRIRVEPLAPPVPVQTPEPARAPPTPDREAPVAPEPAPREPVPA